MNQNADLISYLKSADIFKNIDDGLLNELSGYLDRVVLRRGEELFRQGDTADTMYIIADGKLKVVAEYDDGYKTVLAEVGKGKPIGEMQILVGGKRTASVYAIDDTELIMLSRDVFDHLTQSAPEIAGQIFEIIRMRSRRNELAYLLTEIFGDVDEKTLRFLENNVIWHQLEPGEILFRQGEMGNSLFLIIDGRLQVVREEEDGTESILSEMGRGESIGEMGLLTKEPRAATIRAIRKSELAELQLPAFERIIHKNPQVLMEITKLVINRLRESTTICHQHKSKKNIVIIQAGKEVPLNDFCTRLVSCLSSFGSTMHLNSKRLDSILEIEGAAQTPIDNPLSSRIDVWLDEHELIYQYTVYEADSDISPWTIRCIQRADQIFIVADAAGDPLPGEIESRFLNTEKIATMAMQTLILIHPIDTILPSGTDRWLANRNLKGHHHLRWNREDDFRRLARLLTGHAVGLVLSGGGARGFAHIGAIRALLEAGIQIDMIGGTSMGAVIASQFALGWDIEKMINVTRDVFTKEKLFNDYTLPIFSLIRCRKLDNTLKSYTGDINLEDLWINYFCVSCDIVNADIEIHKQGLMWKAIRASVSLPGITVPVIKGKGLLVDGGIVNNLPGDIMRELCTGSVIAVNVACNTNLHIKNNEFPSPWKACLDLMNPFKKFIGFPNILDIMMQTTLVSSIHKTNTVKNNVDLYISPPTQSYGIMEFDAIDDIIETGYTYTREEIRKWKQG